MMKNTFTKSIAPFALMAALMLTSCGNSDLYLKRPSNTNLEFWITQKVKDNELEEEDSQKEEKKKTKKQKISIFFKIKN